jgi:integrase
MSATKQMKHPLMAATYCTVIGLLFVTGMRIGEAIHLDREDRDWKDGLLVVRNGKFGKAREICLHPTTVEVLRVYESLRDQTIPMPKHPAFFISTAGTRLIYKNVQFIFGNLVRRIGLARRSNRCRPRLHDIRHTFAVRTLTCWYAADVDVQPRLPLLSTYLGHVDPTSTYWYLTATPELVNLARQRLERSLEKLP